MYPSAHRNLKIETFTLIEIIELYFNVVYSINIIIRVSQEILYNFSHVSNLLNEAIESKSECKHRMLKGATVLITLFIYLLLVLDQIPFI
jgi:hypothetical protein